MLEKKSELEKLQSKMANLIKGQKNGSQDEMEELRRALNAKQKELSEMTKSPRSERERLKKKILSARINKIKMRSINSKNN